MKKDKMESEELVLSTVMNIHSSVRFCIDQLKKKLLYFETVECSECEEVDMFLCNECG